MVRLGKTSDRINKMRHLLNYTATILLYNESDILNKHSHCNLIVI